MSAAAVARTRVPPLVLGAIASAWLLALGAQVSGSAGALDHDALLGGDVSPWVAPVAFLFAWQAMTAAMMLPSSLPLVRLFAQVSARQDRPRQAMAAFIGGYALVWTAFGWAAFSLDGLVHTALDGVPWLEERTWLLGGGVLVLAGVFQFSELKDRCLDKCRHPGSFLLANYDRGAGAAFRLGRKHGLFCMGCCWALMLVAFSLGMANLWWMAALTALMVYEKTAPAGERAVPVAGVVLLGWGVAVLALGAA